MSDGLPQELAPPVAKTPAKHANKRTPAQKDVDRAFFEDLAVKGYSPRAILREFATLGRPYTLSLTMVKHDLNKVRQEWREQAVGLLDDQIAREIQGLDRQERELWQAWYQSKGGTRVDSTKARQLTGEKTVAGDKPFEPLTPESPDEALEREVERSTRVETSAGDVGYMNAILECRRQRRAILGLDKPTAVTFPRFTGKESNDRPAAVVVPQTVVFMLPDNRRDAPAVEVPAVAS